MGKKDVGLIDVLASSRMWGITRFIAQALNAWLMFRLEREVITMLQYEISDCNGGFVLWGDYEQLRSLHMLAMELSKDSVITQDEGLLPALAYELRKAYEGLRRVDKQRSGDDEITIYGADMYWPTFISQVSLLRTALAYVDSSKWQQGNMYLIEYLLEGALAAAFPEQSQRLLQGYQRLIGINERSISDLLGSRSGYFLVQKPGSRKNVLPEVIESLAYPAWYQEMKPDSGTRINFEDYGWDSLDSIPDIELKVSSSNIKITEY